MKNLFLLLTSLVPFTAMAGMPEVYCVSTKAFNSPSGSVVNQINVFTNKKGTMRINLQFWATDGQDAANVDTDMIQTIRGLKFDDSTGAFSNKANKVKFELSNKAITPAEAEAILKKADRQLDFENMSGFKAEFSQYYTAKMTDYNLPGTKGTWAGVLMEAFKGGVNEYICGDVKDMKGPVPSVFGNDSEE